MRYLLITFITLVVIGCGGRGNPVGPSDTGDGHAFIDASLELGKVGALQKSAAIDLRILRLVLSSDKGDTIRDSASISGSASIQVSRQYRVLSGRRWQLTAKSYDSRDSLVHSGSTGRVMANPGDTLDLQLSLGSRFSMYRANFLSIPTHVAPSFNGNAQIPITADRLVLKVGGKTRVDSLGSFQGGSATLAFDYVPSGTQTVALEVHGSAAGYTGLLWSGSVVFDNSPGTDETKAVTLEWKGPKGMNGSQTVTLGRVGKNTVDASMGGAD